jgi:predicted acyltransferase
MNPTDRPNRRSRWTDALLTVCGLFVITVFLMLASAFNPNAGLLARFFDVHGLTALAVEVVAILVVAIIVLTVERRESRRRIQEQEAALLESELLESGLLESGVRESEPSDSDFSATERPSTSSFDQP